MLIFVLATPLCVLAQNVKVGDEILVIEGKPVIAKKVNSAEKISSFGGTYESCQIERGGNAIVVGVQGELLLVRYSIEHPKLPNSCDGRLIITTKKLFSSGKIY
ncbi:hypothetical protein ACFLY1_00045 [Patescibacteria group bacterium]